MIPLEDALKTYRAGDFAGLLAAHGHSSMEPGCGQPMLLLLAQCYLKTGAARQAARHFRLAGLAQGTRNLGYLVLAGSLYLNHGHVAEGYACACDAIKLDPDRVSVRALYVRAVQQACLFDEFERERHLLTTLHARQDSAAIELDSPLANVSWCDDEAINARILPATVKVPVTPQSAAERRARPHEWGEKIRIGYLSNDFYSSHPTMRLLNGVLASHDPGRFEITAFCYTSPQNIAADTGERKNHPRLVEIGAMNDERAAKTIRSHDIDILVDLKGHTDAFRPNLVNLGLAPVQVAWLGFPGSSPGIDCDYVISDPIVTPDSSAPHYHEKLCRLPECYQPNDHLTRPRPSAVSRASLGLPEDKVVFGFFNATRKLTPETFRLIVEILKKTENSVLWILFFNDFAGPNFMQAIEREGIDPARIIQARRARYADHISRLTAVDIGLDAFPYNGHTTTSDLLWAGVPVASHKGRHFASRVSESLLNALGLPELVADNEDGYLSLVTDLAGDADGRARLRHKIAANRFIAPLFDTERFTRHLELAYQTMAARARAGLEPAHFDVPALPLRHAPFAI